MLNRILHFLLIMVCTVLALGCTMPITKHYALNSSKGVGVVVASLPESYVSRSVTFAKFDPSELPSVPSPFFSDGVVKTFSPLGIKSPKVFKAIPLAAGHYRVSQVSASLGTSKTKNIIVGRTYTFEVITGEVLYLGDFDVNNYAAFQHIGFSHNEMKGFLARFPNLPQNYRTSPMEIKKIERRKRFR